MLYVSTTESNGEWRKLVESQEHELNKRGFE